MKKESISFLIFIFFFSLDPAAGQEQYSDKKLNHLFKSGTEGCNTFRIPAIIATRIGEIACLYEAGNNS